MNQTKRNAVSRRDFARRAILFSATASLVPVAVASAQPGVGDTPSSSAQDQPKLPPLSPGSQSEADSRLQQILTRHGDKIDDSQKQLLKSLCVFVQPALDRVRAYPLQNGDVPALFLKPLVEREKKPPVPHSATPEHS